MSTRQKYNETNAKSKMGIMVGYWKEGDLYFKHSRGAALCCTGIGRVT